MRGAGLGSFRPTFPPGFALYPCGSVLWRSLVIPPPPHSSRWITPTLAGFGQGISTGFRRPALDIQKAAFFLVFRWRAE